MKHRFIFYSIFLASLNVAFNCIATTSPFISGNGFKSLAQHCLDETTPALFDPQLVKANDIIFVKTELVSIFFSKLHPAIKNRYILITHNSDHSPVFSTTQNQLQREHDLRAYLDDSQLIAWFSQNIDYAHPKLHPIPIGIANSGWRHGNVAMFFKATEQPPDLGSRIPKLYLNFTIHTNVLERSAALHHCKGKPFSYSATSKAPELYLKELKQYRYVLCPAGNGLDCHRTWEALLMGCIPVMKHSFLDPMFEDLPVIFVNEWQEINQRFLDRKYEEIMNRTYRMEKVYGDYWYNLIKSYQC